MADLVLECEVLNLGANRWKKGKVRISELLQGDNELTPDQNPQELLQLIETILIYKLPRLNQNAISL